MWRGRFITIGSFDGVHQGHWSLLNTAIHEAKKRNLKSLALTFRIPPRMILDKVVHFKLLSSPMEKERLLRASGVDDVVILDFDDKLSTMRPFNFFRDVLLRKYKAKGLVVGLDFRFGAERSAGALELVRWGGEFGIPVWVIPPVKWRKAVVSSTLIRSLLDQHQFSAAVGYLGHPYLICGRVMRGKGLGAALGFPTANLRVAEGKILPKGVFAIRGWVQRSKNGARPHKVWRGVCNIGTRPTVSSSKQISVEAHFFGHHGSFLGKTLCIELVKKLRDERKFLSLEALKKGIAHDIRRAKKASKSGLNRLYSLSEIPYNLIRFSYQWSQ